MTALRKLDAHLWEREANEHYVEEPWCSARLFEEEALAGTVWDPACGFGTIPEAARMAGHKTHATDLIDRGYAGGYCLDFFKSDARYPNIVCNPPFNLFRAFAQHALVLASDKVAMIWQTPRLNAAGAWLQDTPLRRIWLMTPRPSMPPGRVVRELEASGKKPGGGTQDYCWLVWVRAYTGRPETRWLHRDNRP